MRKLKEKKEKQAVMEEKRRTARNKRKLKGLGPMWAEDRRPPGRRWGDRRASSPDPRERRRW